MPHAPWGLLRGEDPLKGRWFHSSAEGWVGAGGEEAGLGEPSGSLRFLLGANGHLHGWAGVVMS